MIVTLILAAGSLVVAILALRVAKRSRDAAERSARAAEASAAVNARQLELRERELSRAPWRLVALTGGQCAAINDGPVPVYDVSVIGRAVQSEGTVSVVDGGSQVRFYDVRDLETTAAGVRITWRSSPGSEPPQVWEGCLP